MLCNTCSVFRATEHLKRRNFQFCIHLTSQNSQPMATLSDFVKKAAVSQDIKITGDMKNNAVPMRITQAQIIEAKQEAKELGVLNGSISHGEGNFKGKLGEIIIRDLLNATRTDDEHNYDLLSPTGIRLEIKTSGTRKTYLDNGYWNRVNCANLRQKCHVYVFCAVNEDTMQAWVCGWTWKDEFLSSSTLFKAGYRVPNTGNVMRADSMNIKTGDLFSIGLLKKPAKKKKVKPVIASSNRFAALM